MPANKNATIRYLVLDGLLSDKHHNYNIIELTNKVNAYLSEHDYRPVTSRMIEMDLEFLSESVFRADIVHFRSDGKSCIKYGDPSFSIFTKELSDEEKELLSEVLNTLGQFSGLDNFEWLDGLKNKLDINDTDSKRVIYFAKNPYLANSNLLGELFLDISNKVVLNIRYKPFSKDEKNHIFHPYVLKEYNNRWFLFGYDEEDKIIYNLALDRIVNIETLPNKQYRETDEDFEEFFFDIVGVTIPTDEEVENILIWVSDNSFQYIDTKPLHGSQKIVNSDSDHELRERYPTLIGGHFVRIKCIINYELKQLLASMLGELIILEPMRLREEAQMTVENLLSTYISLVK